MFDVIWNKVEENVEKRRTAVKETIILESIY